MLVVYWCVGGGGLSFYSPGTLHTTLYAGAALLRRIYKSELPSTHN